MATNGTDRNLLTEAIIFAAEKHRQQKRKGTDMPYIVHPLEVMTICLGLSDKTELLIACLLHDTIEDAGVTKQEIAERFGKRVAEIVAAESEDKMRDRSSADSWQQRKQATIDDLCRCTDIDIKTVAFCDKLANLRAICRDKTEIGNAIWQRFNVKDPAMQKWYYAAIFDACSELEGTAAYEEYRATLRKVFG